VSAESWCAALHQGVACAQGQDVVVAHHPGGGVYVTNQLEHSGA
jgi:predicted alpha/beta hydrolase family esterase